MSDVSLSVYTLRSDIKMGKQKVNLSKLVAGKKGSHVPPSSYFAFKGKSLIYIAVKQKGSRGGYTSATVKANLVKKLKGAKSESDIREELDNLAGNPRVVQNRHAITNPQTFDVETRLESTRAFVEVEQDGIDPLEDEDDDEMEDNGEGSSGQKRPASPSGDQQPGKDEDTDKEFKFGPKSGVKRAAEREDEFEDVDVPLAQRKDETDKEFTRRLKRKDKRPDDADLDDPKAKRPNETNEEFARRLKRKDDRPDDADLDDPKAKRPNETDEEFARRLKRKDERPDDADLDDPKAKRPNETDEEFASRLKRKDDRPDDADLDDPKAKRPNETDEEFARRLKRKSERPDEFVDTDQPLPKKDKGETISGLIERLEELRGGKKDSTTLSLLEADENETEDDFIIRLQGLIADLGPPPSYVEEVLSGTLPKVEDTPPAPDQNPVDPSNPVEAEKNKADEEKQEDPGLTPQLPKEVVEKNNEKAKESKRLAEAEAARLEGVNKDLADQVVMGEIVNEEEEEMQRKQAIEAAAAIELAHHAENADTVDVDKLTSEQLKGISNGSIPVSELPKINNPVEQPLTDAQKADKLSGGKATDVPTTTPTATMGADISDVVDPSVAAGIQTEEQRAEQDKQDSPDKEMGDVNQNAKNEQKGLADMAVDQSGFTAPMNRGGQMGISSSANKSEAVIKEREILLQKDAVMASAEKKIAREIAAKKKQDLRDATRAALEEKRQNKLIREGYGKREVEYDDAGMSVARIRDATTPSEALIREILDVITELPGLRKTKKVMDIDNNEIDVLVGDKEHSENLQKEALRLAYSSKLAFAKSINVQRMAPPSDQEKAEIAARDITRKRANEGLEGEFPIFSPSNSISEVNKIQTKVSKQIGEMTITEAQQKRAEMEPWWQEFTKVRTNQAMHEMERMPSRIIESSTGDVQLASAVQADTSQDEKNFYNFMYWMMREKMEKMNGGVYWKDFFTFAGAMGYNDMSEARINWLITGNPDGDTAGVDYEGMDYSLDINEITAGSTPRIADLRLIKPSDVDVVSRTIAFTPVPHTPVPGKNTSPSAQAGAIQRDYKIVDGKIVALADRTRSIEDVGNKTLSGIPSKISNIPDPRFSERGGVQVPNVRIVTRRNPDYVPGKKDSNEFIHSGDAAPGPNDKFQNVEVADVGAGSREIGAAIDRAEGDRLTASLPFKLYAPIHPQACDRYLGEKNYARLSLEPEKYFKSYTQQPFKFSDVQQQLNWNSFVMTVYGPMLYAFVTDVAMQLTAPVFDMAAPEGVTLEFMELNELISELERYQSKSADRSSRVGDSAVAQEPIEKHLSDFFHSRDTEEQDKMADANIAMIALPDQGNPDNKPVPKPPRPGGDPDQTGTGHDQPGATGGAYEGGGLYRPSKRVRFGSVVSDKDTAVQGFGSNKVTLGPGDIDQGVRRSTLKTYQKSVDMQQDSKLEKRSTIFRRFNR